MCYCRADRLRCTKQLAGEFQVSYERAGLDVLRGYGRDFNNYADHGKLARIKRCRSKPGKKPAHRITGSPYLYNFWQDSQ